MFSSVRKFEFTALPPIFLSMVSDWHLKAISFLLYQAIIYFIIYKIWWRERCNLNPFYIKFFVIITLYFHFMNIIWWAKYHKQSKIVNTISEVNINSETKSHVNHFLIILFSKFIPYVEICRLNMIKKKLSLRIGL